MQPANTTESNQLRLISVFVPVDGASDLTPPGGQHVYKNGLTTGNTVTSNSLWNPAVTLTGLLSRQQQYPKRTADLQGEQLTT